MGATSWFDTLARRLASPSSRRDVLRSTGAVAVAAAAAQLLPEAAQAQTSCPPGSACLQFCLSMTSPAKAVQCLKDAQNVDPVSGKPLGPCGQCGPQLNQGLCGDKCVNLQSDPLNCGACKHACTASNGGVFCVNGVCSPGCPSNLTKCGTACVDTTSDPSHCGSCTTVCPKGSVASTGTVTTGQVCVSSKCQPCPTNEIVCNGACIDPTTNAANCGGCGKICGAGQVCTAGKCACPTSGQTLCGDTCVDLKSDPNHCGTCTSKPCAPGQACVNGVCSSSTSSCNSTTCASGCCLNGTCVTSPSVSACGANGGACIPCGPNADSCTGGVCMCGANAACANGQTCTAGQCVTGGPGQANGTTCSSGSQCTSGNCVGGVCCDTACTGTCTTCNSGTCSNVPMGGTSANPVCSGTNACDGAGNCKLASGQACSLPGDCASGICNGGICN